MLYPLSDKALDRTFRQARTVNRFTDEPVKDDDLRSLYDLFKWGPTSTNQQPLRLVWCRTETSKERLAALCYPGNAEKVRAAPVAVVMGMDRDFVSHLPRLFPYADATGWYGNDRKLIEESAFRNSSMQAGYLILAARMLGLDTNPMSGFDAAGVDAAFFPDSAITVNLISTLGHGDHTGAYPRAPRLTFDEANSLM